jgi:acetyl-CoA carboxylase biotin carboxylase subunit
MRVEGPGMRTTVALHRTLLRDPDVRADRHDVQFLDRALPGLLAGAVSLADAAAPPLPAAARGPLSLVPPTGGDDRPPSPTPLTEGAP